MISAGSLSKNEPGDQTEAVTETEPDELDEVAGVGEAAMAAGCPIVQSCSAVWRHARALGVVKWLDPLKDGHRF